MNGMLLGSVAALATSLASASYDWPQFRGPDGTAAAAGDASYPAALDLAEGLAWRAEVATGHGSPIVVGERVVVAGIDPTPEHERLVVECRALGDGQLAWRSELPLESKEKVHRVNSQCSATPASDGERIFVRAGSIGLVAFDLSDGEVLWQRSESVPDNTFGSASSPIVANGKVIVVRDTNGESWVEALEPATGDVLWRRDRPGFRSGWSTPVVWRRGDVHELLVYGAGSLLAYDLATGDERWTAPGLTDEPITMPLCTDGLVLVTSYNMRSNPEVEGLPDFAELLSQHDADDDGALDRQEAEGVGSVLSRFDADGEGDHPLTLFFRFLDADRDDEIRADEWPRLVRWLESMEHANGVLALRPPAEAGGEPEVAWQDPVGVPECPTPLLADGRVFMVKNGGLATCLDASTGALLFRERLPSRGPHYASPVLGGGRIYVASARGQLTVLEAADELRVVSQFDLGERVMATPALARGRVVVRAERHLYAFGGPQ